jgi:integrase
MPSTVVFHSFRHTFKDMCRDALIPRDIHQALTGHAKQTVGDTYGKGYSLEVKLDQMKNIKLDLAIPRPASYGSLKEREGTRSRS